MVTIIIPSRLGCLILALEISLSIACVDVTINKVLIASILVVIINATSVISLSAKINSQIHKYINHYIA
jgi:hypothetical protein